ncbi:DUF1203 domain-containing protein [Sneathiella sp. HT1-7]|uniref:DUF1203 domain-containing protein n=1 Tax=Sneathiella sp. HT1-7 TaxID=2887192 RepID=UPI001D15DCB2|nr:DUF1203 domain-containing protein [Sneathiella sp. HT1-7]MCC3305444.1 DUF1203 domain-containing protein [Sneathiella sp. HT1-7]
MTKLSYIPLPTDEVRALQNGGLDAYGHAPEHHISDGDGNPCRHCLSNIAAGDEFLVLSYRPFASEQPYAEQGPIFLHAMECEAYVRHHELPEMIKSRAGLLLRGYGDNDRIVYGTGQFVAPEEIEAAARNILATKGVAYVHARSATNNCYQLRIELMT